MAVDAKPLILPDRPRGSRWDYALLTATAALPVFAAIADAPVALTVASAVAALLELQWCVRRRGGWRLIGPHAYYDLIRMSRKGRAILFRTVFLVAVLAAIANAYDQFAQGPGDTAPANSAEVRETLARFNAQCASRWFLLQNVTILLLTPAYVGGAIAEERERGMLILLLATPLSDHEIVLGKLFARMVHLGAFLIAGLPVFSIMLVWGGIDLRLLLAGLGNSAMLLVTVGSICLMLSAIPVRASTTVLVSYAMVIPSGACCVWVSDISLQEVVLGGTGGARTEPIALLAVFYVFAIGFCLVIAIIGLRTLEMPQETGALRWNLPERGELTAADGAAIPTPLITDPIDVATRSHQLPPVGDNALLWKERYTGGRSLLAIPEVLVLAVMPVAMLIPMLCVGVSEIVEHGDGTVSGLLYDLAKAGGDALHGCYALCLLCYGIGVAFRSSICVVRERQMHTLDMLLQLPIERHEILRAKWLGAMLKGWPWLAFMLGDLVIGLLIGAYHPLIFLLMLIIPLPLILAVAGAGLLVSTIVRTTTQANLIMACLLLTGVVYFGYTQPPLLVGYSIATHSAWHTSWVGTADLIVLAITEVVLLSIAGSARGIAGWVFARR